MKLIGVFILVFVVGMLGSACAEDRTQIKPQAVPDVHRESIADPSTVADEPEQVGIVLATDQDRLEHGGLVLRRVTRMQEFENGAFSAEIFDAVIEKDGKEMLRFRGTETPMGTNLRLGVTDRLAQGKTHFVIEEESLRLGRLIIVEDRRRPEIVFDSGELGGFREWIRYEDIDNDGILEFSLARSFGCFDDELPRSEIPGFSVYFSFNSALDRFVIVNRSRASELIQRAQKYFEEVDAGKAEPAISRIVGNLLHLVLAGKNDEGWQHFSKLYPIYLAGVMKEREAIGSNANAVWQAGLTSSPEETVRRIEKCIKEDKLFEQARKDSREYRK